MRSDALRQLYCEKCGEIFGRNVVVVLNLEKKATSQGLLIATAACLLYLCSGKTGKCYD